MTKNTILIPPVMILASLFSSFQPVISLSVAAEVSLSVLNPRGEITLPPISPPSTRISDLKGKKIGLYWNEKQGGVYFWNGVEQVLKERLPDTTVLRYSGSFDLGENHAEKMAKEVDAFLYGVGD